MMSLASERDYVKKCKYIRYDPLAVDVVEWPLILAAIYCCATK